MEDTTPCITITKFVLRDPSVLTTASMSVDYIDQYTIENTNTIDTVQAIARITGLNVVQSGPTGQQTSVFMRGMNSNHTIVAINGVAIKDHSTTGGLHDIGADFIKHVTGIQVVKGSQGTLYGANAVGGVINITTKKGKGAPKHTLSFEGGLIKEMENLMHDISGQINDLTNECKFLFKDTTIITLILKKQNNIE